MDSSTEGLNYMPFLSQPTPPSSSRTRINKKLCGGNTTRRSLPLSPNGTLNGYYEGDFTMLQDTIKESLKTSRMSLQPYALVDQILDGSLDLRLDQHFDTTTQVEVDRTDDDADEVVDEEIRGKLVEMKKSREMVVPAKSNYWLQYKETLLSAEQCKKLDTLCDVVQNNRVYRKVSFGVKLIAVVGVWLLRWLFFGVAKGLLSFCCDGLRSRNFLRSCARRLLWWMTLAKYGDMRFFGLIMFLSPLVFFIAALGFIFSTYCFLKNGFRSLIGQVRDNLDEDQPNRSN